MMMKLKGFLFLKLLKPLFIISLISCFTLLGNCSVNAVLESTGYSYYGDLDIPFTQGLYTYNISNFLDFTTSLGNSSKNMFYWVKDNAGYSKYQSFFWYNNYLYTVVGNDDGITEQGYVQNWCITSEFPGIVNGHSSCDGNYSYTLQDIVNINPNFESFTIENLGFTSPTYGVGALQLCFYDGNNYYCVACTPFADRCPSGIITGNVVNIPNVKFDSFSNVPFGRSPFTSSSSLGSGDFVNINLNNYNSMYQSYLRKGYKDVLCYGGYGLDDLYNTGDSLSGLNVGGGATVFDLYYAYGSGLHFADWYNQNDNDYIYFNSFRDGYESVNFLGKSKGLLGLGLVKQIYWKSENPLLSNDLQIFCNIVINHSEDIDHNTWEGSIFDDYLDQNKLNQLIGDIGVVVPTVGTPLDYLWSQYMSGSSSFTGCNSPEECITNGGIDKSVDLAWKTWSIEGLRGNITGILPWYIVFGFLGIMFLYILRR